jgi:DNA-binding MarR family transcriptional regulator
MTAVLVEAGFIEAGAHRLRGNRRELRLTPAGRAIVRRACKLLEDTFAELVDSSGVRYGQYLDQTNRLLAAVENHPMVPSMNGGKRL